MYVSVRTLQLVFYLQVVRIAGMSCSNYCSIVFGTLILYLVNNIELIYKFIYLVLNGELIPLSSCRTVYTFYYSTKVTHNYITALRADGTNASV